MTNVVGAVAAPIEVAGLATAVPPEILVVVPGADTGGCNQVVDKVNVVAEDAAVVRMYSPVYGALLL